MLTKLSCATLHGTDAKIIEVEVSFSPGLPQTVIVGLADTSIKEAKERVRACLKNSEFQFPLGRLSVNLAPANIFKYGTQFDLPIALGILLASEQIKFDATKSLFLGELGFSGVIKATRGVLAMVLSAKLAGFERVFVAQDNYMEARLIEDIEIVPVQTLTQVVKYFRGEYVKENLPVPEYVAERVKVDFADIHGQEFAKRGLEIAIAGGHNILFKGPPGSGKTMLAEAALSIMPEPDKAKVLEIMKIYSAAGMLENKIITKPFRNPNPGVTAAAFVGGGSLPKPGEISLAHNGILFLDEFAEFPKSILESLRQPLEKGFVKVSRMQNNYIFPCEFILVAAQNPCPCGYYGERVKACICSPAQIQYYQRKISGPILDRIDLQIHVARTDLFSAVMQSENSENVKARVFRARSAQLVRTEGRLNAKLNNEQIEKFCALDVPTKQMLVAANDKYQFSARTLHKILKVARTIADLDGEANISMRNVAEAMQYRISG